jgi:pilus assembly protein CpaE
MSEDITSILLPTARVDFFALDEGTAAQAQKLSEDWRFARVTMQIERSGIEAAIARYTQVASPELIIIETNDIGDSFIETLGKLAAVCAEGTDAVIIGPKNDVHLYRSLVEMGIKDYLVRPVSETDMVKVIARTLVDKKGVSGSRLIAVVGAKGGVGTTSMAQLMAWDVAEILKQKTVLMDVSGSGGSIGISFGVEPSATLPEAIRLGGAGTDDDMKRICHPATERLHVLVSGGEPLMSDPPDADSVELLLNRLMQKYPVVVVDLSRAPVEVLKRILSLAVEIVIVTTPLLPALRNARSLMNEIKLLKSAAGGIDLLVNMQGASASEEVPMKDLKEALGVDPAVTVGYLPKIFLSSEATGKPIGQNTAAANLLENLVPLAVKGSGVPRKDDGQGKKKKGLFSK